MISKRTVTIKTKLIFSYSMAILMALLIGIIGYVNILNVNRLVTFNEYIVAKPLIYLTQIRDDYGQTRAAVRDMVISSDAAIIEKFNKEVEFYLDNIKDQVQGYKDVLEEHDQKGGMEYEAVLILEEIIEDWISEVTKTVDLAKVNENDKAFSNLYGDMGVKGRLLNEAITDLIGVNEKQASESKETSDRAFQNAVIFMTFVFIGVSVTLAILSAKITQSIVNPVRKIVASAERLERGNTDVLIDENGKDELAQVSRSFNRVALSIANLFNMNNKMLQAVQEGRLNERSDASFYEGDFKKIIQGFNMALAAFGRHFDTMSEGVAFFDLEKNMLYGNKAMQEFFEFTGIRHTDKNILLRILSWADEKKMQKKLSEIFSFSGISEMNNINITAASKDREDERVYSVALHQMIVENDELPIFCVMMVLADITEPVTARKEAERANRFKSDFLSQMSHEIRTPMNAIIGMTQVACCTDDQKKIRECLEQVQISSHHLLGLINDILDISKIESGKMELNEEPCNINDNIEFVIGIMESRAKESEIEIIPDIDVGDELVMVDSLRLNQVMMNLLSNAIKFSENNTKIELRAKKVATKYGKSEYLFSVKDEGIGMTEKQTKRLFHSFMQADSSITRKYGGTGLGLAISKNIVEMMSGEIWVESKANEGSTFYFTMKLRHANEKDEKQFLNMTPTLDSGDIENMDFSSYRALVVDDMEVNRVIIIELLKSTGMIIEEAENGQEAIDKFEQSEEGYYDIIFMDMQMPIVDGCSATEIIRGMKRADAKKTAILAMTANVFKADIERTLAAGMNGHIGKPIDRILLYKTVSSALKRE